MNSLERLPAMFAKNAHCVDHDVHAREACGPVVRLEVLREVRGDVPSTTRGAGAATGAEDFVACAIERFGQAMADEARGARQQHAHTHRHPR